MNVVLKKLNYIISNRVEYDVNHALYDYRIGNPRGTVDEYIREEVAERVDDNVKDIVWHRVWDYAWNNDSNL